MENSQNEIRFNSFCEGRAVLVKNTPYNRERIIEELLASEDGEWLPGSYRFCIIED